MTNTGAAEVPESEGAVLRWLREAEKRGAVSQGHRSCCSWHRKFKGARVDLC